MRGRRFGLVVALAAVSAVVAVTAALAGQGGAPRVTTLSGAEEVGGGDVDGTGFASIRLNVGQQRVCWEVSYAGITAPFAAHIHAAPAGMNGPIVVPLDPIEAGCTSADPELIQDIIAHPDAYYVNVHNTDFPGGALRGQLSSRGQSNGS